MDICNDFEANQWGDLGKTSSNLLHFNDRKRTFLPRIARATSNFLDRYPVRIDMPLWLFPLAGIVSLIVTILIVSTQAIKAAVLNPVDSLKND